jgi:patatin-like phospholipase/acyl hydrolase
MLNMIDKKYYILSIDGGGLKGIIPAVMLDHLDSVGFDTTKFNLYASSSTGSIITAMLSLKYSSKDIIELYKQEAKNIFKKKFRFIFSAIRAKYDNMNLYNSLAKYIPIDKKLSESTFDFIMTSFNFTKNKVKLFKSYKDSTTSYLEAICSSTAAPTYFNPWIIDKDSYIDGGIVSNNPAQIAVNEAISKGINISNIVVLSLGTGYSAEANLNVNNEDWGMLDWLIHKSKFPLIESFMKAGSDVVDYSLNLYKKQGLKYYRVDVELQKEYLEMDRIENLPIWEMIANNNKFLLNDFINDNK